MSHSSLQRIPDGRRRAVIEHVSPSVDGGAFPFKCVVGEAVPVTAHIFADGHDLLAARLWHRPRGGRWSEVELRALPNDEWEGAFTPVELGFHEYTVVAWVDGFLSWLYGLAKKAEAKDPRLPVEMTLGAGFLEHAATRAGSGDAERLLAIAASLRDEKWGLQERVALALGEEVHDFARRYPDLSLATELSAPVPFLVERARARYASWYEFFPRSWGHEPGRHGTLREAAARVLPEIARLGFDVAYLPPIHPIGKTYRKGRNNALQAGPNDPGSPWAIGGQEGGHKAVHPQLGTLDDFDAFVAEADKLGLEVALDIAFQCSPDHPYVREHPTWFKWRPDGTVQYAENPPKKYQDIIPFDFETQDWKALWEELLSVFTFWVQHGVKIFRVDNPHTKPMEFWRWLVGELKARHPEVILLSEAFTRPKRKYRLAKAGFTQGYTYFTWRNTRDELRGYVEELTSAPVADFFWPNFWPNTPDILHDFIVYGGRAGSVLRWVLAGTLSSNTGIYGPAFELLEREPFPGKEEYNHNEKYEIKAWDWDRPGNLKPELSRLNAIRRAHPALQQTRRIRFAETDNPHLLAYAKVSADGADRIITVVNLDPHHRQAGTVSLPMDFLGLGREERFAVEDLFSREADEDQPLRYLWQGARNYVDLDPSRAVAHIFRVAH